MFICPRSSIECAAQVSTTNLPQINVWKFYSHNVSCLLGTASVLVVPSNTAEGLLVHRPFDLPLGSEKTLLKNHAWINLSLQDVLMPDSVTLTYQYV